MLGFKTLPKTKLKFIAQWLELFDGPEVELLVSEENSNEMLRKQCNGLVTLIGRVQGERVAFICSDFRIYGGGFGVDNSKRLNRFLHYCNLENIPALFAIDSMGVKIVEGRKVFCESFKVIPALKKFSENNLLITMSLGRCLGLGVLLYQMGHYRIALGETNQINLTGQEVFKRFFGEGVDFNDYASAKRQQEASGLVHEIVETKQEALEKISNILGLKFRNKELLKAQQVHIDARVDYKYYTVLDDLLETKIEIFSQMDKSVQTFIGFKEGQFIGVLGNPLGRPNMLGQKTLRKYREALKLFNSLELPICTIVDTAGADPRLDQNDRGQILELTQLAGDLIDYPHFKTGIVLGRCYGGASVLSLPDFFGSPVKPIPVKGCKLGIMSNQIIESLLSGSARLLEEWEEHRQAETADLDDYKKMGLIDEVYDYQHAGSQFHKLLNEFDQINNPKDRDELEHLERRIHRYLSQNYQSSEKSITIQ